MRALHAAKHLRGKSSRDRASAESFGERHGATRCHGSYEALAADQIRTDVLPDVLRLIFTATVHALIGQPGLQGRAKQPISPDRALEGLFTLLAPATRSS